MPNFSYWFRVTCLFSFSQILAASTVNHFEHIISALLSVVFIFMNMLLKVIAVISMFVNAVCNVPTNRRLVRTLRHPQIEIFTGDQKIYCLLLFFIILNNTR